MQKFQLKKDKYREARGGYARFLNIFCAHCESHLLLYQKDGPGPLKRMYADRIVAPEILTRQENSQLPLIKDICCRKCEAKIASPYLYEKENRLAFLVIPESIKKKLTKGIY